MEYKKGNRATDAIIGFGVGARSLKLGREPHAAQRPSKPGGDQGANKNSPKWNEEVMAKSGGTADRASSQERT